MSPQNTILSVHSTRSQQPIQIDPTYEEPVAVSEMYSEVDDPSANPAAAAATATVEADATYEMPVMGGGGAVYGGAGGGEDDDLYLAPAAPQTTPRRVTSDDNNAKYVLASASSRASAAGTEGVIGESTYVSTHACTLIRLPEDARGALKRCFISMKCFTRRVAVSLFPSLPVPFPFSLSPFPRSLSVYIPAPFSYADGCPLVPMVAPRFIIP